MRSDVPLGAFLSGGIDSTIVSGLMQQVSSQPIHTFSIGFPVKQFDETSYAREAAAFLGTRHHEQIVEPHALSILPKLIWHYDEPFSDSSAIPTMYLSEMTRREVTVALSGDGGDEMFCGYDRYRAVRIAERLDHLPRWVKELSLRPALAAASQLDRAEIVSPPRQTAAGRVGQTARAALPAAGSTSSTTAAAATSTRTNSRPSWEQSIRPTFCWPPMRECPDRDFVTRTTCADVLTYLPCDILTKVDIASMAFSLECRCPFLDQQVAELAARMPIELKQSHCWRKTDPDRDVPRSFASVDPNAFEDGLRRPARPLVPRRAAAPAPRNAARPVQPRPRVFQTRERSPADRRTRPARAGTTAIGSGRCCASSCGSERSSTRPSRQPALWRISRAPNRSHNSEKQKNLSQRRRARRERERRGFSNRLSCPSLRALRLCERFF